MWINYQHLYYFYVVAKEGSIVRAGRKLRLTQPTISRQIALLEDYLQVSLFERDGKKLFLTESGRLVKNYAERIFSLGGEMQSVLRGGPHGAGVVLRIGIDDLIPKFIIRSILQPLYNSEGLVRLIASEAASDELVSRLTTHELDLVLTDQPLRRSSYVKGFNHLLGKSRCIVMAADNLARKYRRGFPSSLQEAPFLLQSSRSVIRQQFEYWLEQNDIEVSIRGEFEDYALLKSFAQNGIGLILVPEVIEEDVTKGYGLKKVGDVDTIEDEFYLISLEKRVSHPAIQIIMREARTSLF